MRRLIVSIIDDAAFLILLYGMFSISILWVESDVMTLWRLSFIAVPFWANFYLRQVIKNFGLLLVSHMVFPVAFMIIAPASSRFMWVLFAVFLAGFSLMRFFWGESKNTGQAVSLSAIMFIALSWAAANAGVFSLVVLYSVLLVLVTVGRVIVTHMRQMDASFDAIQPPAAQKARIVSFNYKLMAGLGVVMIAVVSAIYFGFVAPVQNFILQQFTELPTLYQTAPHEGYDMQFHDREIIDFGLNHAEYGEPSSMWLVIDVLLRVIGGAIVVGIIVFLTYVIARAIIKLMRLRAVSGGADSLDDSTIDEREFILPDMINRMKRNSVQEEEHPVRRLFRETVQAYMKKGVPVKKSDTPTDISNRVDAEDFSPLANEYSRVRYGG